MSWNAKGADRGKSYQVYRELQAQYTAVRRELDALTGEIERKNVLIRELAAELAKQVESGASPTEPPQALLEATTDVPRQPVRTASGAFQKPLHKASKRAEQTMQDRLRELEAAAKTGKG